MMERGSAGWLFIDRRVATDDMMVRDIWVQNDRSKSDIELQRYDHLLEE